eukprot:12888714-Prorocentrum_lima.AAC.1
MRFQSLNASLRLQHIHKNALHHDRSGQSYWRGPPYTRIASPMAQKWTVLLSRLKPCASIF